MLQFPCSHEDFGRVTSLKWGSIFEHIPTEGKIHCDKAESNQSENEWKRKQ